MHYAGVRIKAEASGIHYLTSAPPWIDESCLRVGNCLRHPQRIEGSDRPEGDIRHHAEYVGLRVGLGTSSRWKMGALLA